MLWTDLRNLVHLKTVLRVEDHALLEKKKVIKAIRERVRRNLKRSARQTAKDMNASVASKRTILKKYLQLSRYKIRKRQYLTPAQNHKRLERAKLLLGELKAVTAERDRIF